ncbi:ankyrin repeat protein [Colletotrichum plurivorum]|uniref:Ankyrin repeat protein n=1 Tax=Colletotrichum plurivorum TaxID=2175906 RepID=A0A8H6JKG1_9PEZI|nr:ankyrin repeat protein [Colletotrichum plurivorum]
MVARQASWPVSTTTTLQDPTGQSEARPGQDESEDFHSKADTQTAIDFWISAAEELDPERRVAFLQSAGSSSFEDYASNLTKAVANTSNVSKVSRLSKRMKPIYQLSNSIAPILSSASQASPVPAVIVLGGITCVLSLTIRVDDFATKVIEALEWMCEAMYLMKEYKNGSRLHIDPAVRAYEVELATDILRFCVGVDKLYYRGGKKTRGSIRFVFKTIYKSFEDRFGDVKADFQRHLSALEKRRELVNHRILGEMNTKVSDMDNQLRESGDKDRLRERDIREETGRKEEMQRSELKDGMIAVMSRLPSSYIVIDGLDECSHLPDRQFEFICQFLATLAKPKGPAGLAKFISAEVERISGDPSPEERTDLEEFKMKSVQDIGCVEDIKDSLQGTTEDLDELYGKEIKKILEHNNANAELYEALAVKPCRTGLNKSQRLLRNVSLSTEYLNFQYFSSVNVGSSEELSELKSGYPLLEYAATYWGRHFSEGQGSQSKPLGYLLAEFLESQLSIRVSLQVMGVESTFNHQKGQPGAPTPLHMLSILNLFDVADSMPKVKSLLESRDDLARTPIEYSVLYERREMTRWLLDRYLDHHRNGVGFDQGILRSGLLHKAAGHDWIEIIDGLLEMGFDKNELDAEDKTPLHLSAEKGANGVMRRLLELGASTELKDRNHRTPLILAAANENGQGVMALLLSGAKVHADDARAQALHYAALRGVLSMTTDLLDHGADPNVRSTAKFREATPLHFAVQVNKREVIDILLRRGARPGALNSRGQTAVHDAAARGHVEALSLLKDHCKADTSDVAGNTPLHLAAMYDHGGFIKEIIRWYPGLNLNPRSNDGSTPMHSAAVNGASSAVKALMEIDSATIVTKDKEARFPLHLASWFGHLHCATMLSRPGTINAQDKFGATPLKIATRSGYKAVVQYLLEQGAGINQLDNDGMTPVATAFQNEHLAIATLLLNRGADLRLFSTNGTNIFHLAAQFGDKQMLEKLVKLASDMKKGADESIHLAAVDTAGQDVMTRASFTNIAVALYALGIPTDGFGHFLSTPL